MESNQSKKMVASAKQVVKKLYNTASSVQTSAKSVDFFYKLIPVLIILISAIGLLVSQFANCTFRSPFTNFLFGLRPHQRILG